MKTIIVPISIVIREKTFMPEHYLGDENARLLEIERRKVEIHEKEIKLSRRVNALEQERRRVDQLHIELGILEAK